MIHPSAHTDIQEKCWISALPPACKPYALLMRLDRPIGTWLLLLPAWWSILAASSQFSLHTLLYMMLFALGSLIMRGAGCVINDLWDKDFDAKVERTRNRPLASGDLSTKKALIFLFALLGLGLSILLCFNLTTITLGIISLIPVILYPLAKRITWYPQAILGLTFNFGALMGAASITDTIPTFAWSLYAAGLFWTLGYDTIYAQQDMTDDALIGIKSTALKFGKNIRFYSAGFYILTAALVVLSAILSGMTELGLIGLGLAIIHLFWQIKTWDQHDPASSLRIFRSNRDFGLIIAASFLIETII
ncbi:MAG: 4-hydroxybenzoate octaprenyltransferase [Micavibrio sp.]|nr:4-hydroxybenzoate octaprenyltransferase [Micavibrio sp.]